MLFLFLLKQHRKKPLHPFSGCLNPRNANPIAPPCHPKNPYAPAP
ncbi:hypothetical protein [Kingella oralis]